MSLREELIQKKNTQQSGSSSREARAARVAELRRTKQTFTQQPKAIQDVPEEESDVGDAFKRSVAVNVLPTLGGVASGAASGAAAGTLALGPLGTIAGAIGGGIIGAVITKKAQDQVLETVKGEDWKRNLDQSLAEDRQNHPYATLVGEAAPQLITFRPSPSTLKQAFSFSKRILTDPKSVAGHAKTLQGKTELDALMNVGIGSGVDVSLETYQQAREGDVNALRIIGSAVLGGVISDPNRIGVKMGFSPTGDAVIEEYNKFGSKTPAAKIVTHGDVPVLDRSAEGVFADRAELRSILKGEAEANRFDNPRIVEAERIAGTIDKDITADSDINVYRLDGRSGELRPGERVTANPHIADVFGGRINPETTMKVGDLVRTSKGDYVYAPKAAIVTDPILPRTATPLDKEVTLREKLEVQKVKDAEIEAKRKAEEPARLQKEAERKVERLEAKIKKTQSEEQKAIKAEKSRVESEKKAIKDKLDKNTQEINKQRRDELAAEKVAHVKRVQNLKTPLQKTKEQIRFDNAKAKIRARAINKKKKVKEASQAAINKVVDKTKDIQKSAKADVVKTRKEISEIGAEPTTKKTVKKTEKKVQKKTEKTAKKKVAAKPEPEVKDDRITLIGTKKVKSQSVIKNAVQDARENLKTAKSNDDNVTEQVGTTFVEQRKLSAEVISDKGFDEALRFANEASDTDLSKMGINRSALYEILYKTAVREGQFTKYHDDLEALALLVSDEVSEAAQKSSLHRLAVQNDPFRRVADLKKALIEKEKNVRGSVFKKEVSELRAKIKEAGTVEDVNKIIKDNLC
jgi:hypothetical protein